MCNTMPTSEEFTGKMPSDSINRPIKVLEGRKSSKPLMEKRRRARINDSLGQLKTLILEATNKDTSRHSKLEKADILEMTVKYLKNLQRHHIVASVDSEVNATRYRMGYSECITEVSRYLSPLDTNLVDLRVQLLNHLASSCTPNQSQPQMVTNTSPVPNVNPVIAPSPVVSSPHSPQPLQIQVTPSSGNSAVQTVPITVTAALPHNAAIAVPSATAPIQNETPNTNSHQPQSPPGLTRLVSSIQVGIPAGISGGEMSSIQVGIPAGISGGEIALVLPPQAFANGQMPSHFIPVYSQHAPVHSQHAPVHSQHAPVLSPSTATTPSADGLSSPVGTATATLARLSSHSPITADAPSYRLSSHNPVTADAPSYRLSSHSPVTVDAPSYRLSSHSPVTVDTPSYQRQQIQNNVTTTSNIPAANLLPIQSSRPDVTMATGVKMASRLQSVTCPNAAVSLPVQTLVSIRSPLQTSHRQNQPILQPKLEKFNSKCVQEVVAMEEDISCWRPWQRI